MARLKRSKFGAVSGVKIAAFAFIEEADGTLGSQLKMIGRSGRFNWQDRMRLFPVSEIGRDGIDEFVYGQHDGTFRMDKFWGTNRKCMEYLPKRDEFQDSFVNLGGMTIVLAIVEGPYKGKIMEKFRNCHFESVGGNVAANGLYQGNVSGRYSFHNYNQEFIDITVEDEQPEGLTTT